MLSRGSGFSFGGLGMSSGGSGMSKHLNQSLGVKGDTRLKNAEDELIFRHCSLAGLEDESSESGQTGGMGPMWVAGGQPPPPPPNRRLNSANFADLFCRFVEFLNFADLFCRFVGFLGFCRFALLTCWGFWDPVTPDSEVSLYDVHHLLWDTG